MAGALGPAPPGSIGPPGRSRSDLGRIGGTAAAAAGRSLVGSRASSRPASCGPSCDLPVSPLRSSMAPGGGLALGSPSRRVAGSLPVQALEPRADPLPGRRRRAERAEGTLDDALPSPLNLPTLDPTSPDALTDLLNGLHGHPAGFGAANRQQSSNCIGFVSPAAPGLQGAAQGYSFGGPSQASPLHGNAAQASPLQGNALGGARLLGRPGSRDEKEAMGGGCRPPRAPAAAGIAGPGGFSPLVRGGAGGGCSPLEALGGSWSDGRPMPSGAAPQQRSRPSSRPREGSAGHHAAQGSPHSAQALGGPFVQPRSRQSSREAVGRNAAAHGSPHAVQAGRPITPRPPRAPDMSGRSPSGAIAHGGDHIASPLRQRRSRSGLEDGGSRQASSSPKRLPSNGNSPPSALQSIGNSPQSLLALSPAKAPSAPCVAPSPVPPWGSHRGTETVALVSIAQVRSSRIQNNYGGGPLMP